MKRPIDPASAIIAAQSLSMAGWALGTAILIEAVENDPSPDEALSRLFERANAILDHFGREGETEMIGVARASIQGSFEWARQVRERGE